MKVSQHACAASARLRPSLSLSACSLAPSHVPRCTTYLDSNAANVKDHWEVHRLLPVLIRSLRRWGTPAIPSSASEAATRATDLGAERAALARRAPPSLDVARAGICGRVRACTVIRATRSISKLKRAAVVEEVSPFDSKQFHANKSAAPPLPPSSQTALSLSLESSLSLSL